jgi:CheY-like chemotaxis protein
MPATIDQQELASRTGDLSSSQRVLVVDDDGDIRQLLRTLLSRKGFEVLLAEHGGAALETIGEAQPSVILLDMQMPVMDGTEFARVYRERPGPHAPIVAMSAMAAASEWAEQVRADGFLSKPFDLKELFRIVGEHARGG